MLYARAGLLIAVVVFCYMAFMVLAMLLTIVGGRLRGANHRRFTMIEDQPEDNYNAPHSYEPR